MPSQCREQSPNIEASSAHFFLTLVAPAEGNSVRSSSLFLTDNPASLAQYCTNIMTARATGLEFVRRGELGLALELLHGCDRTPKTVDIVGMAAYSFACLVRARYADALQSLESFSALEQNPDLKQNNSAVLVLCRLARNFSSALQGFRSPTSSSIGTNLPKDEDLQWPARLSNTLDLLVNNHLSEQVLANLKAAIEEMPSELVGVSLHLVAEICRHQPNYSDLQDYCQNTARDKQYAGFYLSALEHDLAVLNVTDAASKLSALKNTFHALGLTAQVMHLKYRCLTVSSSDLKQRHQILQTACSLSKHPFICTLWQEHALSQLLNPFLAQEQAQPVSVEKELQSNIQRFECAPSQDALEKLFVLIGGLNRTPSLMESLSDLVINRKLGPLHHDCFAKFALVHRQFGLARRHANYSHALAAHRSEPLDLARQTTRAERKETKHARQSPVEPQQY